MQCDGMRTLTIVGIAFALGLSGCADGTQGDHATTTASAGVTSAPADSPAPTAAAPETSSGAPNITCAPATSPATVPYRTLVGVEPSLLSLDVYAAPVECGAPVVVWVHGGGYQTGDKGNRMSAKVDLAREQGWVLVSVNYRLTDPADPASARFPDHYDDVAHAIAWVHDHISEYGGDPARIAVLGHSAGADIVANVMTVPTYLEAVGMHLRDVRCAGPLDTAGFDKTTVGLDAEEAMWDAALGNNPDFRVSTSATLQVRSNIGIPPMIGVFRGSPRRQALEVAFLDALTAAGIANERIDATSLSHAEVNSRIGEVDDTVMTPPLVDFLDECFAR